jgi:hypothetical protein
MPRPASSGYAEAAEGLRVHYEVFGKPTSTATQFSPEK